jgi:hypothetical protein
VAPRDSDLDKDVVLFFGYAVLRAQLFEFALLKLLEAQHFDADMDPEDRWPTIMRWLTKLTAGRAARKLKVPEPLAADLITLVERRNFVVHHSARFYISAQGTRGAEVIPEYMRWYDGEAAAFGWGYNALTNIVNAIGESPDAPPDDAALMRIWREQLPKPVQGSAPPDPRKPGDRDD